MTSRGVHGVASPVLGDLAGESRTCGSDRSLVRAPVATDYLL